MAKAKNNKKFSLLTGNDRLHYLIEECENGKAFQHLSAKQYNELWTLVCNEVETYRSATGESNAAVLQEVLALLDVAIRSDADQAGACNAIIKILILLNDPQQTVLDSKVKNSLCKVNELWYAKKEMALIPGMEIFTLQYLMSLVLTAEKPVVSDLKRLYSFRCNATAPVLEDHLPILNKIAQKTAIVLSDPGQKFLGHVASLSVTLFKNLYRTLALELAECSKSIAAAYGKLLIIAWFNASDDVKPHIQTRFQDLMEEFIKLKRTTLELPKRSKNVLFVIDCWNEEARKKGNNRFVTMITDCYKPILWKYLQSGLNFQRCNAADLFLKAFPLQLPNDPDSEAELFLTQVKYMEHAMRDDCHIVRVIAIRETCNILSAYWSQFTSVQIHSLMSVITKEDAADVASPEVRRTVWRGLESFLRFEAPYLYLQQILPNLRHYVHDVNQQVRVAFIRLLIAIRDKKDPNFKLTAVVPMADLLHSLANENLTVGRWIVRLLLPSFYRPGMELREWILRLSVLVKNYPRSYRNFFMYSNKALPSEDAFAIMYELITYLGGFVKKKLEENLNDDDDYDDDNDYDDDDDHDENDPAAANQSKKSTQVAKRKSRRQSRLEASTNSQSNCAFDDPAVVVGIFDIITILWVLHDGNLMKPENKEKRVKLLDAYIQFAQCFINYYKDSQIFHSVVTLSGNVPMNLLTANSITLPGYCMKRLKTMQIDGDAEEAAINMSMLIALVKWGRGSQLLEQVTLWLEAAFDSINDQSMERALKKVKIRETIKPNSLLAIHILDTILKTEHTKAAVMRKNYDQLMELWNLLSSVKELVYRRLLRGQPYSETLLSDEFLQVCFVRYVKLIPLLHSTTPDNEDEQERFDVQAEMWALLQWAQDDLLPMLQADVDDCPDLQMLALIVNALLYVCDNMIIVGLLNEGIYAKLGQITISLLTTEHNLHFVKAASRVAASFNFAAKIQNHPGTDELRIFSVMVPSLLSHTLNAMVARPHAPNILDKFQQDFNAVKTNISKILNTYEDNFKEQSKSKESLRLLQLLMEKMLQAVRVVLGREVPRDDLSVPMYSSLSLLPPAAATILASVYNKSFWTPMFIVVLKEQLGRSVKTLLIDILILYLFSKLENRKWLGTIQKTMEAASHRLSQFKSRREYGEIRSLGVTLTEVEPPAVSNDSEDEDNVLLTRELKSDGVNLFSNMATIATEPHRSQGTFHMATIGTESRSSQPRNTADSALSCPISQIDAEPTSSQPTSQADTEPVSSQPLSNIATMGSQPISQLDPQTEQATADDILPPTPSRNIKNIPEQELIEDFIACGEELLDTVRTLIAKRAATKGE